MTHEHQVELCQLSGDPQQDLGNLCALLDKKGAEGFECITILPVQLGNATMANGRLVTGKPQPGFAVVLRRPKEVENGQALLDRG